MSPSGSTEIRLGGIAYRIRNIFATILALQRSDHPHDPWLDTVYQTVLGCKGGAFVDVGANIGQTMLKILAIDKATQYIGFEPQVSCCIFMQGFIEDNGLTKYAVFPWGLSNRNRFVKLHTKCGDCGTTACVIDDFRPRSFYTSHRDIFVRRGDELIEELKVQSISAIKIDVEGGEPEVIEGLLSTIQQKKPFLIFEVLNHYFDERGQPLANDALRFRKDRVGKLESLLREQGFVIYNILPGNLLRKLGKIELRRSSDLSITNYVAMSDLDHESFLRAFPGPVEGD